MASVYRKIDKKRGLVSDITGPWMLENIFGKPCVYCERIANNMGCDRIDNSFGHTTSNCVPCCPECNTCRMDVFSHDEMKIIGKTIRAVIDSRDQG